MNNEEVKQNVSAIRGGDKTAFAELYSGLQTPLYTVIFRIIWDKALAEDILQDVFVKVFLSPPGPAVANPRAYIFRMARNLAIDGARKQTRHVSLEEIGDRAGRPAEDAAWRLDVEGALKKLPPPECQIVTLHVIGELKFREISALMEIPLSTVIWKYQKALSKLQIMITGGAL